MSDSEAGGTYRGECPQCEETLLGVTKQELVEHLRENGETLAAKMVENDTFVFEDCADANPDGGEEVCADATGAQREHCPECERDTKHRVKAKVGENGTLSKKRCTNCETGRIEHYVDSDTDC